MYRSGGVEELERQASDLPRVVGALVALLHEVHDTRPRKVAEVVQGAAARSLHRVEQHALAKRVLGHHQPRRPIGVHHLLEDDRAAQDDVGPAGIESGKSPPLLDAARLHDVSDDLVELVARELEVVQRDRVRVRPGRRDHRREGQDRAGAADQHVEAEAVHFGDERRQDRANELSARPHRRGVHRVASEEAGTHADGAQLQAAGREHLTAFADEELGGSSSDVDEHEAAVEHRHGLQHAEMDEARLLDAGDDLDVDARLVVGASDEVVVVLRLPHRARRDRSDRRRFGFRDATHVREGSDAPVDGVGGEALHVAGTRAEADHLALPRHHIEAIVRCHPRDDEVDRVGADVDRGQRRVTLDLLVGHGADATLPMWSPCSC